MLVRRVGPTKAFAAQIRRAPAGRTRTDSNASVGRNVISNVLHLLPTSELDVPVAVFFDKIKKINMFSIFNRGSGSNTAAQL